MQNIQNIHFLRKGVFLSLSFLSLLAVLGGGCGGSGGDSGDDETAGSTDFEGTLAGNGGETGTLSVSIETDVVALDLLTFGRHGRNQTNDDVTATGVCVFAGQDPVDLSGTFNSLDGNLNLSGDGTTFAGSISGGQMAGSFSNSTIGLVGGFSGLDATDNTVTTYCGTFSGGEDEGVFNVEVDSSGNLSGTAYNTSGEGTGSGVTLSGTATGSSVSGSSNEGNAFSGTITGNDLSGTFEVSDGSTGTFSGGTTACE